MKHGTKAFDRRQVLPLYLAVHLALQKLLSFTFAFSSLTLTLADQMFWVSHAAIKNCHAPTCYMQQHCVHTRPFAKGKQEVCILDRLPSPQLHGLQSAYKAERDPSLFKQNINQAEYVLFIFI